MKLLDRLIAIQQALGASDRKFATMLGVNDSLWTNTRNRKMPIRFSVLSGALAAFPDNEKLKLDVLEYLVASGQMKPAQQAVA